MSATPTRQNPFETARLALIKKLLALKAPNPFPSFPHPTDHLAIADHLREAAAIFDEWLAAIGHQVRDNATSHISADLFDGSFLAAIDGNETGACEQASETLIEDHNTMRRAS